MRNLRELMSDCVLESGSTYGLLCALAHLSDDTGWCRVSRSRLAMHARITVRSVWRAEEALIERGLLVMPETAARGEGAAQVYRAHWERLAPVAKAFRIASRAIMAGAATSLQSAKLQGQPATADACASVIERLQKALRSERRFGEAKRLSGCLVALDEALTGWPGKLVPGDPVEAGFAVENEPGEADTVSREDDTVSREADTVSCAYSIDTSPPGYHQGAGDVSATASNGAEPGEGSGAVQEGGGLEGLVDFGIGSLAAASVNSRDQRQRLLADLSGFRLQPVGDVLLITAPSATLRDRLVRIWGSDLVTGGMAQGFQSIAFPVQSKRVAA